MFNAKFLLTHTRAEKHDGWFKKFFPAIAGIGLAFLPITPQAHATASFSRQTGMACNMCHTTFPELTPFGRDFKLHGYVLSSEKDITDQGSKSNAALSILQVLPLSINLRGGFTQTNAAQPGTRNSNIELPQQVNFWFAGKLAEHIGSYTQMTYAVQANHFAFDNSDFFRYARDGKLAGKDLTWGIDANNDPTFEDLWNSTPAYGFPWVSPDAVVSPVASTLIDGGLGGDVLGLGMYGMWNDHLYGDVSLYRTQHIGGPQPANGLGYTHNIKAAAPYWRFAYQASKGSNYLEVGTFGFHEASYPGTLTTTPAISGPTDSYTDSGIDLTYERPVRRTDLFVVYSLFIYEKQDLTATFQQGGASQANHNLKTYRLDAAYHLGNKYTFTAGPFITTGTPDSLLYPTVPVTGSANNTPKNGGYITQLAWWPSQNIETGVQYKGYVTFNGAGTNYDGSGRNASDNNSTFAYIWLSF